MGTGSVLASRWRGIAGEITIQRHAFGCRRGASGGHGDGQNGVRAQLALVGRAVGFDHAAIERGLPGDVESLNGLSDRAIDIFHRAKHALAEVARLIAVAQFEGFMFARGGARGHRGAPARAVFEQNVGFDGGITARIENLPADNASDPWAMPSP